MKYLTNYDFYVLIIFLIRKQVFNFFFAVAVFFLPTLKKVDKKERDHLNRLLRRELYIVQKYGFNYDPAYLGEDELRIFKDVLDKEIDRESKNFYQSSRLYDDKYLRSLESLKDKFH